MGLNSTVIGWLQELWTDNAVAWHQRKSGCGTFETLLLQHVDNPWDSLLKDVVAQKTCKDWRRDWTRVSYGRAIHWGLLKAEIPTLSHKFRVSVEWTSFWFSPVSKAFFSFKEFWNLLESLKPHDYFTLNALLCCLGAGSSLASAWRSCKTMLGCNTLELEF